MTTEDRLAWFFRQLWHVFLCCSPLDPVDLMNTIEKSGLAVWVAATEEQAKAADGDFEEGDPMLVLTPAAKAAISQPSVREIPDDPF